LSPESKKLSGDDGYLSPHQPHCLGCGDRNPASMGLRLRVDGERVSGDVTFDKRQEGAPGFAHGGAIATVLDDALGTLLFLVKKPAVTGRLEIDYRRPALLERRFDVEAWVGRIEGRKLYLVGELREGEAVVAHALGLFIEVKPEHFKRGAEELGLDWAAESSEFKLPW